MFLGIIKRVVKDKKPKKKKGYTKETYQEYLISDWWVKRKKQYWAIHKRKCFVCGEFALELHHKNYSRLKKELDKDLVPLCNQCHKNAHYLIWNNKAKLKDAHIILKNLA